MSQTKVTELVKIMVVDDNITNLTVAKKALEGRYSVVPVPTGEKALELLTRVKPTLILLDIEMPGMDGFETLSHIKSNPETQDIPVIFLTAKDDNFSEIEGLKLGAVDYVTKPFSIPLLLQRIQLQIELVNHRKELERYNFNLSDMVREKTEIIGELQFAIIHTLIDLVEFRDGTTGYHILRTQKYLEILVETLKETGFYSEEVEKLNFDYFYESAQLHDIGKIATPDNILKKPGKLTFDEFEIMKQHTVIGEKAINGAMELTRSKEFLSYAASVASSHHEKWDGTGYPKGLSGDKIPFIGRLVAIADVYDALVSERPYKKAFSHKDAYGIITSESGKHFDPILIDMFIKSESRFMEISSKYQ